MTNRREFLKCSALLGAAASFPVHFAIGEENPLQATVDPLFEITHKEVFSPNRNGKPRKITIPNVENYKVLKGDFHIHTLFSDGHVMPKARIQEAVNNGLDTIAITDHIEYRPFLGGRSIRLAERNDDHNIAYDNAKAEAEKNNLILIRGTEITKRTMPPGHFNAIFLKDANPVAEAVDDWKKMLEVASNQGAFVFWNHPGWVAPNSGGLAKGVPMSFTSEHEDVRKKGWLHGIEVFNTSNYYPIVSDWCNELNLANLCNSDIHVTELAQYGNHNVRRPMTLILAEDRTEEAIREAFFAHRTIGWAADLILGRPEWVEKLFAACVSVTKKGSSLLLTNTSDIPCRILSDGAEQKLKPQGELTLPMMKKLTVANWLVGTAKPLEVTIA